MKTSLRRPSGGQVPYARLWRSLQMSFALLIVLTCSACAKERHAPAIDPRLARVRGILERVSRESKHESDCFYITPVHRENGSEFAHVYWMNANTIITLILPIKQPAPEISMDYYLYRSKRNLTTDLVPTVEDIHFSNYLVDAGWAEEIIRESFDSGFKVFIRNDPELPPITLQKLTNHRHPGG